MLALARARRRAPGLARLIGVPLDVVPSVGEPERAAERPARRIRVSGVRTQHGHASNDITIRPGPAVFAGPRDGARGQIGRDLVEFVHLMDQP